MNAELNQKPWYRIVKLIAIFLLVLTFFGPLIKDYNHFGSFWFVDGFVNVIIFASIFWVIKRIIIYILHGKVMLILPDQAVTNNNENNHKTMENVNTHNRIAKWSVILGIVIVLNLFLNYALSLVYKSPDYISYCPQSQVVAQPVDQKSCTDKGGQWNANAYYGKPMPLVESAPAQTGYSGYCDLEFTCRQTFESANNTYNRNVFIALVVLGAVSVAIGSFFTTNAVIASGLSLAGVLSFVIASMRYWSSANDLIRVVILLIALSLLFYVAIKKFKNNA